MTNTDTADAAATAAQVRALHQAGSELVRVTVNNEAAAQAVPAIVAEVDVPVIGDFHYNGHLLLTKYPACARALAKYRINPGNVGTKRRDDNFRTIIQVAVNEGKPVRIGVNWGSLDQQLLTEMMDANAKLAEPRDARDVTMDAMVESAMRSAELAEESGLPHDHIILSAKVSGVQDLVAVYRMLAERSDYPLHLGLTEAGMGTKGVVASTAGLSILLQEGIGDTIRVSLTPHPPPVAIGPRKCRSRNRCSNHSAFAASRRRSPHAPGVVAQPRRSFRRWRSRSSRICVISGQPGRRVIPARRSSASR